MTFSRQVIMLVQYSWILWFGNLFICLVFRGKLLNLRTVGFLKIKTMLCKSYIIRKINRIPLGFILKFLSETAFNASWSSLKMLIFSMEAEKGLVIILCKLVWYFCHTFFQYSIWREVTHDKTQNKAFYSSRFLALMITTFKGNLWRLKHKHLEEQISQDLTFLS